MWSVYNCMINAIIQIFVSWTFNVCFTPLSAVNIFRFLAGLNYIKKSSYLTIYLMRALWLFFYLYL